MKCLNTLRLLIFLIPLLGLSQYSKIEDDEIKLFSPILLNDQIKIQNLNLELIQFDEKKIMIDQFEVDTLYFKLLNLLKLVSPTSFL